MATKKEIEDHLQMALTEIGTIKPWFDKEVNEWVFSSPLYPVEYGGNTKQEVIENYPKYLREFILHRLEGRLENLQEKSTQGHGGKREGAGRPKGSSKGEPTKTIRTNWRIANWVKDHEKELTSFLRKDEEELTRYIKGEKRVVASAYQKKISKKKRRH